MKDDDLVIKLRKMQHLIAQISLLRFKYEKVLNAAQSQFNVFSILRNERDEVGLHSRFLAELLDPKGCHQQGDLFLRKFFEVVDASGFTCDSVRIARESRNIDILITNCQRQAIIIENKVDAYDQDEQLKRYINALKIEKFYDPWVIYLTLDGRYPSDSSLPEAERIALEESGRFLSISYSLEIRDWLAICIKESASFPVLRETLVQYRELVDKLTGNSLVTGHLMEIKNLLLEKKDNFLAALDIEKGLIEAKIDLQWKFWDDLQNRLEKIGYQFHGKVAIEDIKGYYIKKRANANFAIEVVVLDGIATVGIDGCLDIGIITMSEDKEDKLKLNKWVSSNMHDELTTMFETECKSSENWPWYIPVAEGLDFDNFSEQTLSILDENERKKVIDNIVDKFQKLKSYAENKLKNYK